MKIVWITLHVKSLKESLHFYNKVLGFKVLQSLNPKPNLNLVFLDGEGVHLELIENTDIPQPVYGSNVSFALELGNLEERLAQLRSEGINEIEGPVRMGPDYLFAFIKDPNGFKIQLSGT